MKRWIVPVAFLLASATFAQQSASFKLEEHVLNAGGHPAGGVVLASASHRISLDAIGEAVSITALASGSWGMDAGFTPAYPPPGEVTGLLFTSKTALEWDPERSVGSYNLYRDLLGAIPGLGYGVCLPPELPEESATDGDEPPSGQGFFYLVTAENRLDEEGTKGFDSSGTEHGNPAPCP